MPRLSRNCSWSNRDGFTPSILTNKANERYHGTCHPSLISQATTVVTAQDVFENWWTAWLALFSRWPHLHYYPYCLLVQCKYEMKTTMEIAIWMTCSFCCQILKHCQVLKGQIWISNHLYAAHVQCRRTVCR